MLLSQITMNFVVLKIKLHSPMSGGQRSQGAKIEMSIGLCSFWRLKRTNHFLTVCFMCCPPPWDHNQLLPPQPLLFRLASTIVTSLLTVRLSLIKMLVMTLVPPGYLGSSPPLRILHVIISAKAFCHGRSYVHRLCGLGHPWGSTVLPSIISDAGQWGWGDHLNKTMFLRRHVPPPDFQKPW